MIFQHFLFIQRAIFCCLSGKFEKSFLILREDHVLSAINEFRRLANNLEDMIKGKSPMTNKLFCSRMYCRDTHLELKRQAAEDIGEKNTNWFRNTN